MAATFILTGNWPFYFGLQGKYFIIFTVSLIIINTMMAVIMEFLSMSLSLSKYKGLRRLLGIIKHNEVYSPLQRELSVCNLPAERRTADICFMFPRQETTAAHTEPQANPLCYHKAKKLRLSWGKKWCAFGTLFIVILLNFLRQKHF